MKKRTEQEKEIIRHSIGRICITLVEIAAIVIAFFLVITLLNNIGIAEDDGKYVMCMDRVNVRMGASSKSDAIGWLEPGDVVYPDGQRKNGFVHCEVPNTEYGEGWIHKGYLIDSKPERIDKTGYIASNAKVKARKYVDGKRTRWLKPGGELKVYYWSDTWCLTDCGYVMTDFIELGGE